MRIRSLMFAVCAAAVMTAPAIAAFAQTPAPAVRQDPRAAQAEKYMHAGVSAMITDLNIGARFVGGGKGVVYRLGKKGEGRFMLASGGWSSRRQARNTFRGAGGAAVSLSSGFRQGVVRTRGERYVCSRYPVLRTVRM